MQTPALKMCVVFFAARKQLGFVLNIVSVLVTVVTVYKVCTVPRHYGSSTEQWAPLRAGIIYHLQQLNLVQFSIVRVENAAELQVRDSCHSVANVS